jgi:RimJ/RimL family protein N-acetyltransferase
VDSNLANTTLAAGAIPASSKRLRFRALEAGDTLWLTMLCGQSQVKRYLLGEAEGSFQQAQKIIAVSQYCYHLHTGFGFWATSNEEGALIGLFSLLPAESESAQQAPEMGVRLLPKFWSRWYGVEGGRALSKHAFDTLKLDCVHAHTHPENLAAIAIARRVGFILGPQTTYFSHPAQRLVFSKKDYQRRPV